MAEMADESIEEFEGNYAKINRLTKYRDLLNEAMGHLLKNEKGKVTVNGISDIMKRADELVADVADVDEAVLDAKLLGISSSVLKQNAEAFDVNLYSFKPKEFSENLLSYMKDDDGGPSNKRDIDWSKLAGMAKKCFRRTPSYTMLYGTFEAGGTPDGDSACAQKKTRKQREKEREGKLSQPVNVENMQKEEDGIEDTLHYIMSVLNAAYKENGNKPICFIKLILNPHSFSATVENIFHMSFLVKDGHVELTMGDDARPVIAPVPDQVIRVEKESGSSGLGREQRILTMNMDMWEELRDIFEITEPMLEPSMISKK